jgi:hypothetical protein
MLPAFQAAPQAPDVVCRQRRRRRRKHRFAARCGVGECDPLMHDAGELSAGLPELRLGFAREARVRARPVQDEDAANGRPAELLAHLVGLVERFERLGDRPEVERARLDRHHGYVGGYCGALCDVA